MSREDIVAAAVAGLAATGAVILVILAWAGQL